MHRSLLGLLVALSLSAGSPLWAQVSLAPALLPENSAIIPVDEVPLVHTPAAPVAQILLPPTDFENWTSAVRLDQTAPGQVRLSYAALPSEVALIRLLKADGTPVYARQTLSGQRAGSLTLAIAHASEAYRVELTLPDGQRWEQTIPPSP